MDEDSLGSPEWGESYNSWREEEESDSSESSLSRENKRVCLEKEDRISGLKDKVLLHVLSFLPTKDAVKTCVLSKRWTELWTSVPCLSFILESNSVDEFVELVENALILNRCSKIFKFHLDLQSHYFEWLGDDLDPRLLDIWIGSAVRANVEEISLYLCKDFYRSKPNPCYLLPRHIYACSSLTKLNLSYCNIVPHGVITWTLLKSLSIKETELSESVIRKVLSGSPALKVLEICQCSALNRLDIICASLRKLVIKDYWMRKKIDTNFVYGSLEIYAPNIKSLEILGNFGTKFRLVNVSSLVTADIGFELKGKNHIDGHDGAVKYYKESQNMLREVLYAVRHVKELTLGFFCFQIVTSLLEVKSLFSSLSNCKSFTLKALIIREQELLGFARLLRDVPHLEILTIDPSTCDCNTDFLEDDRDDYEMRKMSLVSNLDNIFKYLLMHDLKTVKIVGSHACNEKQIISLAEFLLKNARVLETMAFGVSKHECHVNNPEDCCCSSIYVDYNTENLLKIAQKLLSFPRSSPHANIMFSW